MSGEILCYTIYTRDVSDGKKIESKGAYLTKEAAETALAMKAEKYCIDKVGIENFICGQLDSTEQSLKVVEGFALSRSGSEILINRRYPGRVFGVHEVPQCFFGILPIHQDQYQEIHLEGQRKIERKIDPISLGKALRQTQTVLLDPKKRGEGKQAQSSLMDRFQIELKEAVSKFQEKKLEKLLAEEFDSEGEIIPNAVVVEPVVVEECPPPYLALNDVSPEVTPEEEQDLINFLEEVQSNASTTPVIVDTSEYGFPGFESKIYGFTESKHDGWDLRIDMTHIEEEKLL